MIRPLLSWASPLFSFAAGLHLAHCEKGYSFGGVEAPVARSWRSSRIDGKPGAGLLAAAGLQRLGLKERITAPLEPEVTRAAVRQGAMAHEPRGDDAQRSRRVAPLEDATGRLAAGRERCVLARPGGGCQLPGAGCARISGEGPDFRGLAGRFEERARLTASEGLASFGRRVAGEVLAGDVEQALAPLVEPVGAPER